MFSRIIISVAGVVSIKSAMLRLDCASVISRRVRSLGPARYVSTLMPGYFASKTLAISRCAVRLVYQTSLPSFFRPGLEHLFSIRAAVASEIGSRFRLRASWRRQLQDQ